MSTHLLARKGEANPATSHPGGESRFQARRVIVLPQLSLKAEANRDRRPSPLPKPAARMGERGGAVRKKFTFRIEPDRHARFCERASALGISRQELLTRALDAYLAERETDTSREPVSPEQASLPFGAWNVPVTHIVPRAAR